MNTNQGQFDGVEDPNWAWTSENKDEMDKWAEGEVNKVAQDSDTYKNPFIPANPKTPF